MVFLKILLVLALGFPVICLGAYFLEKIIDAALEDRRKDENN